MDHIQVLKRAWQVVWRYRALWVFGIIVALTAGGMSSNRGGGGSGGGLASSGNGQGNGGGAIGPLPNIAVPEWLPQLLASAILVLIVVGLAFVCAILVLAVVTTIARNVARTSLIRMVDDHEITGETRSVKEGFRMGWSRAAWHIYLSNLVLDLPLMLLFVSLFALAGLPLLLWITRSTLFGVIGTVAAIGLFFLDIIFVIIVAVVVNVLKEFFWRRCTLEGVGAIDGIRQGVAFVRRHLRDTAVMWLLMVGIRIGWAILMIPLSILLVLAFALVGIVVGGIPALIVGAASSLFLHGAWPWIVAAVVGVPLVILTIAAPFVFVNGLFETYRSTVWTLAYREMRALEDSDCASGDVLTVQEPEK